MIRIHGSWRAAVGEQQLGRRDGKALRIDLQPPGPRCDRTQRRVAQGQGVGSSACSARGCGGCAVARVRAEAIGVVRALRGNGQRHGEIVPQALAPAGKGCRQSNGVPMTEAIEPRMFDVGDQHRKCVSRGILQARETFIGREGRCGNAAGRARKAATRNRPSVSAIMSSGRLKPPARDGRRTLSPPPATAPGPAARHCRCRRHCAHRTSAT